MTFLLAAAGVAAGAAGIGGLTIATGGMLGLAAGSALGGSRAAKSAGETQAAAASQAADVQKQVADQQVALQREMFERTREDQAPYRTAGYNALAQMQRTAGNVPAAFKFGAGDYQADPGYAFRLSEGQKALDRQAAARGGLISGGALKAAQRFGQDMGSQEYQSAYNRALTGYNTDVARENQLYNRQAALSGTGQTATNLVGQAGQNYATSAGNALGSYGTNVGNLMTSGAAAQAAGQVGQANAITGGLGTYMNYSQNNALLNALRGGNSSLMSEPYPGYNASIGLGR
jgi:hypothetical protein